MSHESRIKELEDQMRALIGTVTQNGKDISALENVVGKEADATTYSDVPTQFTVKKDEEDRDTRKKYIVVSVMKPPGKGRKYRNTRNEWHSSNFMVKVYDSYMNARKAIAHMKSPGKYYHPPVIEEYKE